MCEELVIEDQDNDTTWVVVTLNLQGDESFIDGSFRLTSSIMEFQGRLLDRDWVKEICLVSIPTKEIRQLSDLDVVASMMLTPSVIKTQ